MAKFYEKRPVIKTGPSGKAYADENNSTVTESVNVRNAVPPRSQTFLQIHLSVKNDTGVECKSLQSICCEEK